MDSNIFTLLAERPACIEAALREALAIHAADAPATLVEAMSYSLFSEGKRLRPILTVLACEAAGGTLEQALPAACAVEMIHTYSLIHDDLPAMDDDDLRRGRPTCHIQFNEALAILSGDALLTMAFELVAGYPAKTAAVSCLELARGAGAAGMVGGQVLDMQSPPGAALHPRPLSPEGRGEQELQNVHRRKTGALFRSSLRLGVYATQAETGVKPDTLRAIDDYANAFGLAFQVTDDLLDVTSSAEKTGKRVGKDAERGKLTYPGLLGIEASRAKAAELGRSAVAAAKSLGPGGELLAALAVYVVGRDR